LTFVDAHHSVSFHLVLESVLSDEDEDSRLYRVVVNHEEQYSIWLADRPAPEGWTEVGAPASKQDCLDKITTLWTDMRPLSLRRSAEEAARSGSPA
jgi:MbtH protein